MKAVEGCVIFIFFNKDILLNGQVELITQTAVCQASYTWLLRLLLCLFMIVLDWLVEPPPEGLSI